MEQKNPRKELLEKAIALYKAGYTHAEVAKALGINESTVRSLAHCEPKK